MIIRRPTSAISTAGRAQQPASTGRIEPRSRSRMPDLYRLPRALPKEDLSHAGAGAGSSRRPRPLKALRSRRLLRRGCALVTAFGELLDHLLVERRDVVRLAARYEPVVDDDLCFRPPR